eukprot:Lithocolla_globosa_v1_NODE_1437_length_2575_cov_16.751587.p2 type:complete len:106 gc:universal NODE_1437_length_2575_cov_16.751587:1943-1626(-)
MFSSKLFLLGCNFSPIGLHLFPVDGEVYTDFGRLWSDTFLRVNCRPSTMKEHLAKVLGISLQEVPVVSGELPGDKRVKKPFGIPRIFCEIFVHPISFKFISHHSQ